MSKLEIEISSLLLKEHFGDIVQKVGTVLLRKRQLPLGVIGKECGLKIDQVKKGLCSLIQHNMVTFELHKRGFVEYEIRTGVPLLLLRYPRYIYASKTLYGDAAELIIEEILHHGQINMSSVVDKVTNRLNEAMKVQKEAAISKDDVVSKFKALAETQFIKRCPEMSDSNENDSAIPKMEIDTERMYKVPRLNDAQIKSERENSSSQSNERKRKIPKDRSKSPEPPDAGIYWHLNFQRFHTLFRDQELISAVANKLDKEASEVLRSMLRIDVSDPASPVSQPLSSHEIYHQFPKNIKLTKQAMDQYLTLLTEDSTGFVRRVGDMGGGTYVIDYKDALKNLAVAHIECVVRERFGSKSLRIFRLLLMKKQLEQKQIEEFALIPAKEAKEMLYKMFEEDFVTVTEVSKTADHAPSRTFYLFSVNITQVSRKLLDQSFQALCRLIQRREYETKEHRRLLDKQQKVEAISASLTGADEEQRAEIEDTITPPEREQIDKVKNMTKKLEMSELQVDETIFILQMYLLYAKTT
ncbi:unnamed protein product [Owenia fusiformis]|uniref:DNA-directed RNA polymerase III subunit RPC3 n=1 Tax=Owenia fusiformis TaxID=6347 RepID=A0A8J1TV82_OWEFU|nr:unnamed protein product [Owenia fusiformis]